MVISPYLLSFSLSSYSDDCATDQGEVCNKGMSNWVDLLCHNAHPGRLHTIASVFILLG